MTTPTELPEEGYPRELLWLRKEIYEQSGQLIEAGIVVGVAGTRNTSVRLLCHRSQANKGKRCTR